MLRVFPIIIMLSTCGPDETLTGYGQTDDVYVLQTMNDTPVAQRITLSLSDPGRISGDAPCYSYTARQTAPYPWFDVSPIAAMRMACPDLALEVDFFAGLQSMMFAEALGDTLILTNEDGDSMVFQVP
ncbi:META domain-containing protein [Yoonia sp. 208BN28-4]|uniref:META domain-containing protein n=1 Tax=Yoonia sp. 208BN28-4 TaxID=3126505 RepID=UPI003099E325